MYDYDDEDNWIHSIKHLQQYVANCGCFVLFLILSSTTTNNDRVNGVDNNDNASIGIEKHGFSFKTWCSDPTMTCEDDELLVLSLQKRPCLINISSCNWKCPLIKQQRKEKQQQSTANHHHYAALKHKYDALSDVTVAPPAYDYRIANAPNNNNNNELSQCSMSKAIYALQKH